MRWSPGDYLRFAGARARPALDLLARLPDTGPPVIWDLGCGTGEITLELARRRPGATVSGLDTSPEMLAAARESDRDGRVRWVEGDIAAWRPGEPPGLVFSNAALHWLDGHDALFPSLAGSLAPGGALAVQMPRNSDEPTHTVLEEVASRPRWQGRVAHLTGRRPVAEPAAYYDLLAPSCTTVDVWETVYLQRLEGVDPVARWVEGAAARPYLACLGDDGPAFLAEYAAAVRPHYPPRADGTTLLPFRRLFLIATR